MQAILLCFIAEVWLIIQLTILFSMANQNTETMLRTKECCTYSLLLTQQDAKKRDVLTNQDNHKVLQYQCMAGDRVNQVCWTHGSGCLRDRCGHLASS
jgi:hypothetical protein